MSARAIYGSEAFEQQIAQRFDSEVQQVARLAAKLCSVASVTVPASATDFAAIEVAAREACSFAEAAGLRVHQPPVSEAAPYPFVAVTFAEHAPAAETKREMVGLIGHLDVVPPKEEGQFSPYLEGDDLYARGSADMKTVVASYLVWMARWQARSGPKPPVVLLLSCCEENGSHRPNHMVSALGWLRGELGINVRFAVVGERTGELEWMHPELQVGPVCRENRSWRWLRAHSDEACGLEVLQRVAGAVELARTTVHRLNEQQTPEDKKARQPGVRSGLVNAFCFVGGDRGVDQLRDVAWLTVTRSSGASIHSAAAKVDQPSLVERFGAIARQAVEVFGEARARLAGVEIGQDGNFNTYDGSGVMKLALAETPVAELSGWAAAIAEEGLELRVSAEPIEVTRQATLLGFDLRELLDHREAVEQLLDTLKDRLFGADGFGTVLQAPPWRCPEDHPDLQALLRAYEAVVGEPSPDLVKLHGNDGGNLVAFQQSTPGGWGLPPGVAPVVVFGQVGMRPHGAGEFHRLASVRPYLEILDRWAAALRAPN